LLTPDLKMGMIFAILRLSGTRASLNEELIIHDNGVATKEIEDLAIEGLMSSTPAELEFFSKEDTCIISACEVGSRPK